jgi:hypothetical protein
MRYALLMLLVVVGLSLTASGYAAQFEEISASASIPGSFGIAWGDYDADGFPDLLLPAVATGYEVTPHGFLLYRNNHDLTFTDVSAALGFPATSSVSASGAAWGDYNNDGRLDLLAAGAVYPFLFRRDASQFVQVDAEAGFDLYHNSGASVSWCDYDGDSLLDALCSNLFGPGYLMHNDGDGTFTESSAAAGMAGDAANDQAQSAAWGDYDNDGWPDLLLARQSKAAKLYHNEGDGTFTDVSVQAGVAITGGGMAATWADYDNDGWLDCYLLTLTDYGSGDSERDWLFHNNHDGTFTEVGAAAGLAGDNQNGMGAVWADYDNDGYLDLYVSVQQSGAMPFLYRNDGDGTFTDVFASSGLTGRDSEVAAAWADIDLDGRMDLFQALTTPTSRLFHNIGTSGDWLRVRALTSGTGDATDAGEPVRNALGARVDVNLDNDAAFPISGSRTLTRTIDGGYGSAAQGEQIAHFGLGAASLVAVRVRFPDGSTVVHRGVAANQQITLRDVPAGREEIFSDVPLDFWAYPQILAVKEAGIASGYLDGTYGPSYAVTRDQMAVYIARALAGGDANVHVPTGVTEPSFADVPDDYWAYRHIEYCKGQNIVAGYWDGYHPTEVVNRAQMAVYIARSIADPTGETGLAGYTPPTTSSFSDVATDYWAYKHIEYCKAEGVVNGYGDGTYGPENPVTRDQMAVYVVRAFGLSL